MPFSWSFLNENITTFLCKIFLQKKNLFIFYESAYQSFKKNSTSFKSTPYMQSNLCKTSTLGNTQKVVISDKWSSYKTPLQNKHKQNVVALVLSFYSHCRCFINKICWNDLQFCCFSAIL